MSSENAIRFQVIVNGEVVSTAGYNGHGTLSVILSRVLRDPADWPSHPEMHIEEIDLTARGIAGGDSHTSSTWFDGPLKRGDEITIKILGDGPIDEPSLREDIGRHRTLVHLRNVLRDLEPMVEACAEQWLPDTNEHFITFNMILDDIEDDYPDLVKGARFDTEGARANLVLESVRAVRAQVEKELG